MDFENLKNWVIEHQKDILFCVAMFLAIYLAFGIGFIVGKDRVKNPIEFEQKVINQEVIEEI